MTTAPSTAAQDGAAPDRLDVSGTRPVPFGRLVALELRKTFDTRAGFWLLVTIGLIEVVALVLALLIGVLNDGVGLTANALAQVLSLPLSLLVPVFAIMVITGEWGQRTTLTTFALEPHRMRVVAAKLLTVLAVALATIVLAVAVGALGNLLYGALSGDPTVWNLDWAQLGWVTLQQVLFFVMAFALGLLLLSTPGAIVVYYVAALLLPWLAYSILFVLFDTARDIIPWIDLTFAMSGLVPFDQGAAPAGGPSTGEAVAQTVVASGIWIVLPMALGALRVQRTELK